MVPISQCPFVAVSGPHWRTAAADHTWQHKPARQAPVTGAKCVFFPRHVLQTISLKVRFIARLFFLASLPLSISLSLSNLLLFISCSLISLTGIYTTFIGFCFLPLHGIAYCVLPMYCGAIPLASPRHHFTNYPSLYSLLYLSEMIFDPSQGS